MRYFEVAGTVRQAISVVKKRSSDHERTIRECKVQKGGLFVGKPLREFQGVLTGVPRYMGAAGPLLEGDGNGNGSSRQSGGDGVGEGVPRRRRKRSSR